MRYAVALLLIAMAGCSTQSPPSAKSDADEAAFCESVIDVVKPDDEKCGRYLAKIRSFKPGVPGRDASEVCQTTSKECRQWTDMAKKCEENMRRRDAGYMGRLEPYCDQAEAYREQVTGVQLSTAPGAYSF